METPKKCKVISLYGGPGTGKSTTATALFAELKFRGVNCEYVPEFAKDKAWEYGTAHSGIPKVFQAQEFIFGEQHFRIRRCAQDVEYVITDCPLFLGLVYMPEDFPIPSLRPAIHEAYNMYENLNVFLVRSKAYNPKGRFQSEEGAKGLDVKVREMLEAQGVPYVTYVGSRRAVGHIINKMESFGWNTGVIDDAE
jgi:nicotinamide riboside kinase